ncbi:SDR family oxidoreductase [Ornithinibacillus halotolerans]|uniref:3-beta hydroxysteroid dehydrogenase n=1 Tax=Ornithinibacillus halotolerans TaxID=1274357 RepID=A0A916S682_9BACI|nr:SDR family oxidoreductase [Ornithinibacillus halotolerans]GGA85567.1 3-beta hydroxysteroid dehydrogenase [Ornithinibacillus halotolerans]
MKHSLFITGFPGFLASSLISQLIHDHNEKIDHIYLLVLPNQQKLAQTTLQQITNQGKITKNQFSIVIGDITKEDLAIKPEIEKDLLNKVTHAFHLAAIYDLAVPKKLAYQVNVNGTKNVNNWVAKIPNLQRYIYFSTAYVSGKREGKIYEHELIAGQEFRNHYEHTKYLAEVLVQEIMGTVPTTIIRPGVVKGHSTTGETIKFDGLYFQLNVLDKLKFMPVLPYFGKGTAEGNFVPSDYVLEATSYLSFHPNGEGKVYHLTDPNPYKMWELQKILTYAYLGRTPKGRIPLSMLKALLSIKPLRKWLKTEVEALDYFMIHSSYDSSQTTKDLEGSGIACPDLIDTVEPMINFYRKYKDDESKHIKIN